MAPQDQEVDGGAGQGEASLNRWQTSTFQSISASPVPGGPVTGTSGYTWFIREYWDASTSLDKNKSVSSACRQPSSIRKAVRTQGGAEPYQGAPGLS